MRRLTLMLALATGALPLPALAADETVRSEAGLLRVSTITDDLTRPWAFEFLPDGAMLVTEKGGTMRIVSANGEVGEAIAGVPEVDSGGQGGLLDVALDPDFAANRTIYFTYSEAGDGGNSTAIGKAKLANDGSKLEDVGKIFTQLPKYDGNKHFGSRIVFDREGHLFAGFGERSDVPIRENAQKLDNHLGKVIRINRDGSVPKDNPFVGQSGARPEIWSYGHRNIQGAALNPETGALWVSEHGPKGGDEVNVAEAGRNYGWPLVSFGVNYDGTPVGTGKQSGEGLTQPIHHWTPVIGASGMAFYTADAAPGWKGSAFFGGLATRDLVRVKFEGTKPVGEERLLDGIGKRIRDVQQGPDGAIYVATDDGEIMRVGPAKAA
ncbi:PQQ-dependent sugar dehydrogenase [Aureimonas leprariae]|uniref:PQQ-dependent sugar dehydrogenase n=1 Tax=Plantimonas leprariae TaxID=2615207 RepID=A0A7V7TWI6_9HYPH|nr:PQQ-dependent sugar dehydrogenase [Aureimonas leprariae]KAB0679660.1 PQQ-dependent sugar dehydrogenase [Aureimonas leprariae]